MVHVQVCTNWHAMTHYFFLPHDWRCLLWGDFYPFRSHALLGRLIPVCQYNKHVISNTLVSLFKNQFENCYFRLSKLWNSEISSEVKHFDKLQARNTIYRPIQENFVVKDILQLSMTNQVLIQIFYASGSRTLPLFVKIMQNFILMENT